MLRRPNRVDRYLQIAIGAILESDWAGKSRGHLAVQLALCGTSADCSPTDQVGQILGGQQIKVFGSCRHTEAIDRQQQPAGGAQAFIDIKGFIQIRIINQPFPTYRRTGFFKVHPHNHNQIFAVLFTYRQQALCVRHRGIRIMNRARSCDHDQAVVIAVQDFMNIAACCRYEFSRICRQRHLSNDGGRICHVLNIDDTDVVGLGCLHDEYWLIDRATPAARNAGQYITANARWIFRRVSRPVAIS